MLRLLVVVLLLANAAFYSWRQGWLDQTVGVRAQGDREPGRLAMQVEPQRVRVLPPGARAPAPSAEPTVCLEVGPFDTAQLAPAQAALQSVLPQDRIEDVRRESAAVWIVFMGPFAEADARRRKLEEVRRLKVTAEEIRQVPELGDGLSLGRFETRAAAEKALADLPAKGVRTARLAQFVAPTVTHVLRVREVTPALQSQLVGLPGGPFGGHGFVPCGR